MGRYSDVIAVLIVALIILIVIPVPTILIDILLTLNISLSLVIFLLSMYIKDSLQFSVFPTILLITTLFRLCLNFSTTRLILGEGYAGEVVNAFGNFVTGSNPIVGFIMFLILVIVQYVVITKGAERVSEVSARFTLDAMPGKQMAIDADLNSGLINEMEAKERRKAIQQEADFYGAMDGASKFVKGDAIAGIIITVINIIGGFAIGMLQMDLEFTESLSKFTNLTIGDGLVTQIPALLVSIAAGMVVTRAASNSDLGTDIIIQLLSEPKVLYIASGALFILAFTGLPPVPNIILACLLAFLGYTLRRTIKAAQKEEEIKAQDVEVEEIRKPENVMSLLQVDPIELEFGYGIIPLADVNQGGDLLDRVVMIRRQCALDLGLIVPVIRLRDNIQLKPNDYVIKIKGIEVASGELMFDNYLAMNPGTADGELDGIKTTEPAFGLPAVWISENQKERAEMMGYTVVDPPSVIATHLTEIIKNHAHELLGRQDVQRIIDNVKENYPALVEDVIPKQLSIGDIQKVLANLLKEGVSIRDMVTIMETLADYAPMTKDTDMLTEYVRQSMRRNITKRFIVDMQAKVITLDATLEQTIMDSVQQTEYGSYLNLEPNAAQRIINNLLKEMQKLASMGEQPIILASPIVRLYFKRLTEQVAPGLVVLSYNELDPLVEIQSVGVVSI
ncbi:MAG TPA: flagellar biosynthesis protein FlhA [Bacillota bacterium]|nr:flagellar biosynthesis protein FlhA [Bacillota bacterium]HQE66300.1 flagellar biosynthesis protein FlhA [Bacillota bacterium]HQI15436.1 flagellar biosynthesis protein FlhA [Bacillota bacterium]HQJ36861.1 flagellar biosynthesis protein FlhA [Bacillota bacterium]HQL37734.1 flagellar biosynthesis protein FlhA [Bacillota bacterium]